LNCHTLGVDGSQVGVLEERNEVCFGSLLESKDGRGLEAKIGFVILSNLTNETLEWELADEQLSGLLITTNFTESDSSGPEAMGLLTPAVTGTAVLRAALVASCLRGALPPVDLRAVCLVRAMISENLRRVSAI